MNTAALAHLQTDPVMAAIIARVGHIDLTPRRLSPFQSIVQAIIHQQLSGKAAETILRRFLELFPADKFPSAEAVARLNLQTLRTAGVSRQKGGYLLDLAQKTLDGIVPTLAECDGLDDAELIERFTCVKGVGRWTVEMLLIVNLGRPDVLPVHDLGVRRGFQVAYRKRKMPEPKKLELIGRRWAPHRTLAARYLWRAADEPVG